MQRKKQLNTRKTARFTNAGINAMHVKYNQDDNVVGYICSTKYICLPEFNT